MHFCRKDTRNHWHGWRREFKPGFPAAGIIFEADSIEQAYQIQCPEICHSKKPENGSQQCPHLWYFRYLCGMSGLQCSAGTGICELLQLLWTAAGMESVLQRKYKSEEPRYSSWAAGTGAEPVRMYQRRTGILNAADHQRDGRQVILNIKDGMI